MATRITSPLLLTLTASLILPLHAASLWEPVNVLQRNTTSANLEFLPENYSLQSLDETKMREQLSTSARSSEFTEQTLEVPLPSGELIELRITEKVIMEAELSAKYPNFKTFSAQGINNPHITGVIGINELGFHGMLFTEDGRRIFVDRREANGEYYYISYYDTEYRPTNKEAMTCNVEGHNHSSLRSLAPEVETANRNGDSLRTYRIAFAATGEYTAYHGGTKTAALSAINTTLARVNEMYERDLSVTMTLVANTDQVIYTDSATDPFTNDDGNELINESQSVIHNTIGSANYDIGHTLSTGGGGLAGLGVVCGAQKASGITGASTPQNDPFDIDYVAHEIGHQFGGNHTFNSQTGSCRGGNRSANTAYEPGSGATIMAYAGICGDNNLQNNSDAMFHAKSIEEMSAFINDSTAGGSCGTTAATGNNPPVANAGSDYTIPVSTPFELSGSATDPDNGDTLSYSWEQVDAGTASDVNVDMGNNAIFRTFLPVDNGLRTIPKLSDLLAGTTSKGEVLPATARTINFALAVRDQKGGVNTDNMQITVDDSGSAFAVTSHNSATLLTAGTSTNVTWNAGTTASAPVSCPSVNILLSTDGGNTFPTTLESSTPNDGSQSVTIPEATAENSTSRIKVACANNIFFDISDTNISIELAVNVAPVANNGTLQVTQNIAQNGTVSFSDANSADTHTVSLVSNGSKGTVNITNPATGAYTYTPKNDELGSDSFTFKVNDGEFDSNTATITVTINEPNYAPTAANGTLSVVEDIAKNGTLGFSDNNQNDTHTVSIVSNGTKGSAVVTNPATGAYTYTPNAGENGSDSFTFKVNDGTVDSNTATVNISISSTNSLPVATNAALEVLENTPKSGMLGFSDADQSDTHIVSIVSNGGKGTASVTNPATGAFTYTPNTDTFGADTFTFKVADAEGESTAATISVNIIEFNHAPSASNSTLEVTEDSSATGTLSFSDANTNDSLAASIVSNGTKGIATITNPATGAYLYTPEQGQTGEDTFTFNVNDGLLNSNTATVTVTINEYNRPPVANDAKLTVAQDSSVTGTLTASDFNAADSLSYSIAMNGSKGTATITNPATGAFTYTPTAGQTGEDVFTFVANDGTVDSSPATITVTINSSATATVGGEEIRVTSNVTEGTISGLNVMDEAAIEALLDPQATPKPSDAVFEYDFIDYEVTGLTNGATITIDITYPSMPANPRFYKVDAANGYVEFTNFTVNGNTVTLTLTDGGDGDADGLANGTIVDPIGLDTSVRTTTNNLTNSGSGGGSHSPLLLIGLLLLLGIRRLVKIKA